MKNENKIPYKNVFKYIFLFLLKLFLIFFFIYQFALYIPPTGEEFTPNIEPISPINEYSPKSARLFTLAFLLLFFPSLQPSPPERSCCLEVEV